jgi:hypothetical protein
MSTLSQKKNSGYEEIKLIFKSLSKTINGTACILEITLDSRNLMKLSVTVRVDNQYKVSLESIN